MAKKKATKKSSGKKFTSDFSKDKLGTIHDLPAQLANIAEMESENPTTKRQITFYIKQFNELGLFSPKANKAKKENTIKKLKLLNFDKEKVLRFQDILKSVINFNRIIDRQKIKVEQEIRSGQNVKKNEDLLRGREKKEFNIPRKIREDLNITNKAVKLLKYSTEDVRNKIKYHSGQDYDFQIKTGFGSPVYVPMSKIQKLRTEDNVVDYVLNIFEDAVTKAYQRDKRELSRKDKPAWKKKMQVYTKIYKVIGHNRQIATNKKYHKKLIQRDEEGDIKKNNSEYPVFLELFDEIIEVYIP